MRLSGTYSCLLLIKSLRCKWGRLWQGATVRQPCAVLLQSAVVYFKKSAREQTVRR